MAGLTGTMTPGIGKILRAVVALLFVTAAVGKILDPYSFAETIRGFQIVRPTWSIPLAFFIPALELVAGPSLMTNSHRRGATLIVTAMTVIFSAAIVSAMVRGLDISCGCFGASGEGSLREGLLRNLVILAALGIAWAVDRPAKPSIVSTTRPSSPEAGGSS